MNDKFIYILVLIANCFISAFSQVLLKKASLKNYESFLRQYLNPFVILGYGLFFIVLFINVFLLKKLPLPVVSPIGEALRIVLSFVTGQLIFNEKLSSRKITGVIVILCGLCLILV